ncbi:MAG: PIN domain-containing protein [Oscillospiraceae bacterium]|nr:PIN domain-containing protein [Oscillospiraceae bacterium]
MTDRIFVDSNLWVYLFTQDGDVKSKVVKEYITKSSEGSCLVISYQVVNEVCHVLKKKNYTEPEIRDIADDMMGLCEVCGYSGDIIYHASELREKYSFSFWDSHIAASALRSQCSVLASEDMQDGLKIDSMVIRTC